MVEWRPIIGFPSYAVSSSGTVKRVKPDLYGRISDREIKPTCRSDGYFAISLHNEGRQSVRLLHRIVCEAFRGPSPAEGWHVAHGDGIKSNNSAANLRWATPASNNQDKRQHGTLLTGDRHPARIDGSYLPRGSAHKNSKLSEEAVIRIRADKRSHSTIAREYGVSQSLITMVKGRRIWAHV